MDEGILLTDEEGNTFTTGNSGDVLTTNSIPVTLDSSGSALNVNVVGWGAGAAPGVNAFHTPVFGFSSDSDTGIWQSSSNSISISATIGGIPFTRETMREHMENAYIVGKLDKTKLIEYLKAFHNNNGLDMAETMEEIELAREKFIQSIKESI